MENYTRYPIPHAGVETIRPDSFPYAKHQISDSTRSSARSSDSFARNSSLHYDGDHRGSHESKPRLSKEQQDILERHFRSQPKPSTSTKRGFADNLEVPLDKINNWFQNRRAKVKQDAKKQQSAYNMFYASQLIHGQSSADPQYVDPAFYHTMMDSTPRHSMMFTPGMHMPGDLADHFNGINGQLDQPIDSPAVPFGVYCAEPSLIDTPDAFNQFFGFAGSPDYHENVDHTALSAFSKQFNPPTESFDGFSRGAMDIDTYNTSTSASLMTRSSNDSCSNRHSNLFGDERPHSFLRQPGSRLPRSSLSSSQLAFAERRESCNSWTLPNHADAFAADAEPTNVQYGTIMYQNMGELPFRHPAERLPAEQISNLEPSHFSNEVGHSILPSQPVPPLQPQRSLSDQCDEPMAGEESDAPMRQHNEARDVEFRPEILQLARANGFPNQPAPPSGLAARRQRRPATLSTTPFRSASYNMTVPPSPSSSKQTLAPDMNIRRIKSSNGVYNGRVQKCNVVPAQRSPLHFSFEHSTAPSTPARQLSYHALTAPTIEHQSGHGQMQLLTPQSPLQVPPSYAYMHSSNRSSAHIGIPEDIHEEPESMWPCTPTTSNVVDGLPCYDSPPATPMDYTQLVQMHLQVPSAQLVPPPPNTAPWEQSFQVRPHYSELGPPVIHVPAQHMYRPSTAGEDVVSMLQNRRPSFPNDAHGLEFIVQPGYSVPMMHASSEFPSGHSRQQPQQHAFTYSMQAFGIADSQRNSPANARPGLQTPVKPQQELLFHEYTPREPADASRLPPRTMTSQPKTYQFVNQGPENLFLSPQRPQTTSFEHC